MQKKHKMLNPNQHKKTKSKPKPPCKFKNRSRGPYAQLSYTIQH